MHVNKYCTLFEQFNVIRMDYEFLARMKRERELASAFHKENEKTQNEAIFAVRRARLSKQFRFICSRSTLMINSDKRIWPFSKPNLSIYTYCFIRRSIIFLMALVSFDLQIQLIYDLWDNRLNINCKYLSQFLTYVLVHSSNSLYI